MSNYFILILDGIKDGLGILALLSLGIGLFLGVVFIFDRIYDTEREKTYLKVLVTALVIGCILILVNCFIPSTQMALQLRK
jgi:uncharacterized membrane protein YidH (DUF202 family)